MKIDEKIYDFVLYNRGTKKFVSWFLRSGFAKNRIYNVIYQRHVHRKMERYKNLPFRVMIENTNICGADCIFCPHRFMKREKGIMELELSKKIIDECKALGIEYVTIYGFGEPLLDPHFFERIKYAKSKGISRVTTNTNAGYLNDDNVKKILESRLDEIYISFDAATEEVYKKIRPGLEFSMVEKNILSLVKAKAKSKTNKPEIILSFVESSLNTREVDKYIRKWKDKVDHISISLIHNWTGDIEFEESSNEGRRDPCRLLWTDMVISWNGDVPLCCNDYENKVLLGNINERSIQEIWSGLQLEQIRQWHLEKDFTKSLICKNCKYNYHHKSPWWVNK